MRTSILPVLAVLLSMAVPTTSAASSVAVEGGVLLVVAAPGETNTVSVSETVPPGSDRPSEYNVVDQSAGAIAGSGCRHGERYDESVHCAADAVKSVAIHLGDGEDTASSFLLFPTAVYGEGGSDDIFLSGPDTLADGGEGNDNLRGGDDLRGGPGDDQLTGSRLLDGGEGNDHLRKTGATAGGRLAGGAGDDNLQSDDGWPDQLQCGAGRDTVASTDDSDRNDGSCELGKGVAKPPPPAQVTVFELPKGNSRPGRDGRLAVWMRCSVPACVVDVRIFSGGDFGKHGHFVRFRNPPLLRVIVGATAKLVHLRLNRAQRRGLSRNDAYESVGAVVITRRPGADARLLTDGLYCSRSSPCGRAPRGAESAATAPRTDVYRRD